METAGWRPVMGKMTLQIVMDAGSRREGGSYRGGRVPLNDVRAGPCSLGQSKRAQSLAQRTAPTTRRTTREEAKQAWRTWIPRAGKWLLRICVEQCAGWRGLGEAGEENPGLITLATLCWGRRGSAGRSRTRTSTRIRTNNQGKYRQSRIIRANNTYISHASARWKMEKNLGE